MTSTRKRTVVRPLSVSSRMRAASSWWRGDGFNAEIAEGAEFFRVGEAWVLASMKVWAWRKPRLRS